MKWMMAVLMFAALGAARDEGRDESHFRAQCSGKCSVEGCPQGTSACCYWTRSGCARCVCVPLGKLPEPGIGCDSGGGTGCSMSDQVSPRPQPEAGEVAGEAVIDMAAVSVQSERTAVLQIDGEPTSLVAIDEVTLDDGTPVAVGDSVYEGEVIVDGAVQNVGTDSAWVMDANGGEYEVPPGGIMAPGCMKACSMSGCPVGMHAVCHAVQQGGRDCCKCSCENGGGGAACTCRAADPV